MAPKIELSVDKTTVIEGDIVEMRWSCQNADSVELTLDNGFKKNTIPVEAVGSKKFRLNRSNGRTHLVIGATVNGKTHYKSVAVRVKKMKATKAEEVHDYTGHKGIRNNGLKNSWENFKTKFKYAWSMFPANKQLAFKIMMLLGFFLLLSAFIPKFQTIGLLIVMGYLCWVVMKR